MNKPGRKTLLNAEEEEHLVGVINTTALWRIPLGKYDLRLIVMDYLNRSNRKVISLYL